MGEAKIGTGGTEKLKSEEVDWEMEMELAPIKN
jgi:hypothetical protein